MNFFKRLSTEIGSSANSEATNCQCSCGLQVTDEVFDANGIRYFFYVVCKKPERGYKKTYYTYLTNKRFLKLNTIYSIDNCLLKKIPRPSIYSYNSISYADISEIPAKAFRISNEHMNHVMQYIN